MLRYDINSYRELFPVTKSGTIYLNHAATSPLLTKVVAAINKYLDERSTTEIDNYSSFQNTLTETREFTARLLNTTPDRVAFFDNTTNAINLLATGIEWKTGDRIVLNDIEFPANVYPFLNLKRLGVEIDFVKNRDGRILLEDIESVITPRTKLLSISHVQFLTGYRSDLRAISEICTKRGIIFSVDAIQSAGVVQVDVKQMGIDFLAAGGQKWLMAPQGIALAYVSEETQQRIKQAYLGWTSIKNFFGDFTRYRLDLDESARRYESGTQNYIGITSLHESLSILLEAGIDAIEEHVLDLSDILISELRTLGLRAYVNSPRHERSGIVSIPVSNAEVYRAELEKKQIKVAVRQGMIRVSPHFYNTEDEVRTLIESLGRIRSVG